MDMRLSDWLDTEVKPLSDKPVSWLSEQHFFRDPSRPRYSDLNYFLSPADGVLLYQKEVEPDERVCEIKGVNYSLNDLMRRSMKGRHYVVGVFMTFYDVHVNRAPYPGRLFYKRLPPIHSANKPMLAVETSLLDGVLGGVGEYLYLNERVINTFVSRQLGGNYYVIQIADYDVDTIMPFETCQNEPVFQGDRFSMIRYGSQVDLVIPINERYTLSPLHEISDHVLAGESLLRLNYA